MHKVVNGVVIQLTKEEIDKRLAEEAIALQEMEAAKLLEYKEKRAAEYPSVGDQLDILWKLLDGLPDIVAAADPEVKEMQDKVTATKLKYPKPADPV